MPTVEETLLELEGRYWRAAGDVAFYRENFADDGVMAFSIGVLDKDEILEAMDGAGEWESFTIDDHRFVQVADDVAALNYTTSAVAPGSEEPYEAAITSVYVRREGRWLLVLHQQSPLQ